MNETTQKLYEILKHFNMPMKLRSITCNHEIIEWFTVSNQMLYDFDFVGFIMNGFDRFPIEVPFRIEIPSSEVQKIQYNQLNRALGYTVCNAQEMPGISEESNCTCDFNTVVMVHGCQCGGK